MVRVSRGVGAQVYVMRRYGGGPVVVDGRRDGFGLAALEAGRFKVAGAVVAAPVREGD